MGKENKRLVVWLMVYAIAMAYLEAAVVVYLRELYFPENILKIFPPKLFNQRDALVELGREVATIVMMGAVALISERRNRVRMFAAFVLQFGIWDVFYYIWLKVLIGWPVSWSEWDILFLIPWAWLGPWITPVVIALIFIVWGWMILSTSSEVQWGKMGVGLFIGGAILALIAFLQPAFQLLVSGESQRIQQFYPTTFWWWLYLPGVLIMTGGLFKIQITKKATR